MLDAGLPREKDVVSRRDVPNVAKKWLNATLTLGMGLASGCAPAASRGVSRDVAAHSPRVHLPASFPTDHEHSRSDPGGRTRREPPPVHLQQQAASPAVLPFLLHAPPSEVAVPVLQRFPVRFAPNCVSAVTDGGARRYSVNLEGTFAAAGYALRARYDGHTSRSLVLARRGRTQLPLEALANEWAPLSVGVHELVVFARDQRGVVPRTPRGALAFEVCRFEIAEDGAIRSSNRATPAVLLSPEGTLHGAASEATLMQVGGALGGWVQLRIGRPDGGAEVHELNLDLAGVASHAGLFELAPLQNGDYTLVLLPDSTRGEATLAHSALGYVQRLTVNREGTGAE